VTGEPQADGVLEERAGIYSLRFERWFDYPVDRVWQALTEGDQLRQWVGGSEVEVDLRPGGKIFTRMAAPQAGEPALSFESTILRVEPARLFEHTFGDNRDSVVRWELAPEGSGCRLLLTHLEPPGFPKQDAPRDLAGWHELLAALDRLLAGRPGAGAEAEWERQRERYAARLQD
jgi:uncharacterized protein YndB with AHSA1/START domain